MGVVKPFRYKPSLKKEEHNFDFVDFMWYKNLFSPEECERIKSLWTDEDILDAEVNNNYDKEKRDDLRKSTINFIKPGESDWVYDKLSKACMQANTKRYKFDINGFQTELQLAKYEDGGFFDWHMDFGSGNISNRKLSISVQLSSPEEYEGGELQFMVNQNSVDGPKDQGTAVIFPSFFPHRVQPVTKGCRMSIVGWIAGPPYK